MSVILAIDPGTRKCGIAVVSDRGVLHGEIAVREAVPGAVKALLDRHAVDGVIIGGGTGSRDVIRLLHEEIPSLPIRVVEEFMSTLDARKRFFEDNPPRGLRRLVPRGLLLPNRPIDDYAAVLLAERYLRDAPAVD